MKRFNISFFVAFLAIMATFTGQARTITVNASSIKGDLTQELRQRCAQASYSDTLVINFDREGTFILSGSVSIRSNVIIKGKGRDKTTVMLDKGSDRKGFKAFAHDAYFDIEGSLNRPIGVAISDLTLRLKDHKGIWWDGSRCHAIKIYHANRVDIHDMDSYMQNAVITNMDMRVCSNVTVTRCIISNYNNCEDGGGLWIRGEMHNINIKHNKFYKYGKDETLAIYDRVVDDTDNRYLRGKASRTDIFIEDNEFTYGGYTGKGYNPDAVCGMVFSLFTDHAQSNDRCTTRNFHLSGNKFFMNDASQRCLYIGFDPADVHKDIYIENNQIINNDIGRDYRYYHKDIEVHDLSTCGDSIHIVGNNVVNKAFVLNEFGSTGYMFLQTRGGIVDMRANNINNLVKTELATGKKYGMELVWCQFEGGTVVMRDNVCKGLKYLAYVGGGDGTPLFTLKASNNYFEGDTRVYSHKIKELRLEFTRNTFKSDNATFFLEEFAPKGSVVFNNNNVTVTPGNGQFLTHWGNNSTHDFRFERFEVKNNVLQGVNGQQDLFKNVTNVGKRKVEGNTISR